MHIEKKKIDLKERAVVETVKLIETLQPLLVSVPFDEIKFIRFE